MKRRKPKRRRRLSSSAFALLIATGLVALLVGGPLIVVPFVFDHATVGWNGTR